MVAYHIDVFTFDEPNKLMIVDAGVTDVTCQQIHDAAREFEGEPANLDLLPLVKAGGKDVLDAATGKLVGITLTMLDDWRVQFPAAGGPTVEIRNISGGNFLAINSFQNVPIAAAAFISIIIAQDSSATVVTTVDTTSGLTATESAQLAEIDLLKKLMRNKMITDPTTGLMTLFDDDGTTVLFQANIYEDVAAAIAYRGKGIELRNRLDTIFNVFATEFSEEFD